MLLACLTICQRQRKRTRCNGAQPRCSRGAGPCATDEPTCRDSARRCWSQTKPSPPISPSGRWRPRPRARCPHLEGWCDPGPPPRSITPSPPFAGPEAPALPGTANRPPGVLDMLYAIDLGPAGTRSTACYFSHHHDVADACRACNLTRQAMKDHISNTAHVRARCSCDPNSQRQLGIELVRF